jgi:hypothetical protein
VLYHLFIGPVGGNSPNGLFYFLLQSKYGIDINLIYFKKTKMNHKNTIVPISIVGLIMIVIVGGLFILNPYEDKNNEQKEINEQRFIEENERPIEPSYVSTFGELERITKPKFKVGENYFYHRWKKSPDTKEVIHLPEEYDTIIEVKEISRENKSDYYVLESKNASVPKYILVRDENGIWKKKQGISFQTTTWVDENGTQREKSSRGKVAIYEGCIMGVNKDDGKRIEIEPAICPVMDEMFREWMLYLNKGVGWIERQNSSNQEMGRINRFETEWKVAGIEQINEIKCFKVIVNFKKEIMGVSGKKISGEVTTYWIDTEKRILVKMERKENNILIEKIELTQYEPA